MKVSYAITLAIAGTAFAVPTTLNDRELNDRQLGSGRPNFVSDIFDTGACIVSSFIGGGNPNCRGRGKGGDGKGDDGKGSSSGSGSGSGSGNGSGNGSGSKGDAVPDKDKSSGTGGTASQDNGYSYSFTNHADGSATYTVVPNRNGKSCQIKLAKEERDDLKAVLGKLAKECS